MSDNNSLLIILCASEDEAIFFSAKIGNIQYVDKLFVFLKTKPGDKMQQCLQKNDRSITLENLINHTDCSKIAVRAAVLYSNPQYWNLLFCWAADNISSDDVFHNIKLLNEEKKPVGKIWGDIRENIAIYGWECVYENSQNNDTSESEYIDEDIEIIIGLKGKEISNKSIIKIIAECANIKNIGIHNSVKYNNLFFKDIENLINLSTYVNQKDPSTIIFGHDEPQAIVEFLNSIQSSKTAIVFSTKENQKKILELFHIQPYRIIYGKEDICVSIFLITK